MKKCVECEHANGPALGPDMSCTAKTTSGHKDDVDHCPFCGALRITPQQGGFTPCGCMCTMYGCGTLMVNDYLNGVFASLYSMSAECMFNQGCRSTDEDIV